MIESLSIVLGEDNLFVLGYVIYLLLMGSLYVVMKLVSFIEKLSTEKKS